MPIFFNLSDKPTASLSAAAGAEITTAIETLMRVFQSIETGRDDGLRNNLRMAAEHFRVAGKFFRELESTTSADADISPHVQEAWANAEGFAKTIGNVLRQDIPYAPVRSSYSARELMNFASYSTDQLAQSIDRLAPRPENPAAGRQIAAQAIALQMFGLLIAVAMSETSVRR